MVKTKFYYNHQTCKYEPIIPGKRQIILNFLGFIGLSLIIAAGLIIGYHKYFTPVKESMLLTKNTELKGNWEHQQHKIELAKNDIAFLREKDDYVYRTILDIEPIPGTMRQAGAGGSNRFINLEDLDLEQEELIISTFREVEKLKQQLSIQKTSYNDVENVLNKKKVMWDSRPAIHPLNYKDIQRTGGGFGMRFHPVYKKYLPHKGLDVTAVIGTEIYATGDGIVKERYHSRTYGNVVFIDHGYGYETRYAHMIDFNVKRGQHVNRGDLIGFVGSSGVSTAPHIHYEVLHNNRQINPVPFLNKNLSNEEYEKIVEISENSNLVLEEY